MQILAVGTHIGKARVVRVLGVGSVAVVYEVILEGRRRAMKVGERDESSKEPARLEQEGDAIAMVEHINVVKWFDTGLDDYRVWILLELVEGQNLRELVRAKGGRLTPEHAVGLIRQAAEGVAAIHKKKIVHRDLKPENLLIASVNDVEIVKVADLGSCKMPGWGVKTATAQAGRLGTMRYAAPEQWRVNPPNTPPPPPDPKSDVYALGVILYELIAGHHPIYPGPASMGTMCKRQLECEPLPLAAIMDVPGDLSALVQKAMSKDPATRYTMRKFADELETVLDPLLVWRRSAARSVGGITPKDPSVANTAPIPVPPRPDKASNGAPPLPPTTKPTGKSGTIIMNVPSVPTQPGDEARDTHRDASPPPFPRSYPATLRSETESARNPPAPQPQPAIYEADARRSTGAPVMSAPRSSATPKPTRTGLVVASAVGGGVLALLVTAAWWSMFGGASVEAPPPKPKPAASAASTTPSSSAQSNPPPTASSSKPASPTSSATSARVPPRAPAR